MKNNKKPQTENQENNESAEVKNLAFDKEKGSYELDVNDNDPDWDHPANYETVSEGAEQDTSEYDSSNPFVGSEYADLEELQEQELEKSGMHITKAKNLKVSKLDKELGKDDEDLRDDLDEEGYPINQ